MLNFRKCLLTLSVAGALGVAAPAAFATPIVTGQLVISPTVASLQAGGLASDTAFYLIYEGTFTVSGLKVDILGSASGVYVYDQSSDLPAVKPTLADGTYQSWIVHSDHVGTTGNHNYLGSATFDAAIVGLMLRSGTLSAADGCGTQINNPNPPGNCNLDPINALFGTDYMRYSYSPYRGLELGTGTTGDRIAYISPNQLSITQFNTSDAVDEVRILTLIPTQPTSVPEPTSILLLGLGLVGLVGVRRTLKK